MYTSSDENIIEKKKCRLTGEEFVVTDADILFYKKFGIPTPTLCPRELWRNLFAFRNERNLFPRTCSKTGQNILSCYRPDTIFPVYNHKLWWSDDWSGFDYGRDFDFSRPYFEQYKSLQDVVPRVGTTIFSSENCDYNNQCRSSRNCYLCSLVSKAEDAYYSYWTNEGRNIFDSSMTNFCENIYDCLDTTQCNLCVSCQECRDCQECYFSYQLRNCQNCIACSGLVAKQYHIYNKPVTKEEYEKTLKLLQSTTELWEKAQSTFRKIRVASVRPWAQFSNVENSTGDHLQFCRDCMNCFDTLSSENLRHVVSCSGAKDCAWCYSLGFPVSELCTHTCVALDCNNVNFSFYVYSSKDFSYADNCYNSSNLFGCIGLNHGKFSIMNKAYPQQEYETLKTKIIDHMRSTGEWGQFFPLSVSPHPYEDTAAMDWYPLGELEVLNRGGRWGGEIPSVTRASSIEGPLHIIQYDERVIGKELATSNIETLLKTVFRCPVSGKPFQIIRQELVFHLENSIPLPTTHPRERQRELMKLRNPRELFERSCDECAAKIATSYALDRPEKVLCEACYMKHMY